MPATASNEALTVALRQCLIAGMGTPAGRELPLIIVAQSFVATLAGLAERTSTFDIGDEAAERIGREAAERAIAASAWDTAIGERIDTTHVCRLLDVSRQALAKRQQSGSLIGLAGRRIRWFPAWQFDREQRSIRPVVADIVSAFREHLGKADPVLIAAWATTPQDDLDGRTPAQWAVGGNDGEQLTRAAHRAAVRLAQ